MNPERLMTVSGTLVTRTPGPPDQFGGDTLTETLVPIMCWYSQPGTEERAGQVFQTLTLYTPPTIPLNNISAVELPNLGRWEVRGQPISHMSPRTRTPTHTTIRLERGA